MLSSQVKLGLQLPYKLLLLHIKSDLSRISLLTWELSSTMKGSFTYICLGILQEMLPIQLFNIGQKSTFEKKYSWFYSKT